MGKANYGIDVLSKDNIELMQLPMKDYTMNPHPGDKDVTYWGPVIEKDGTYYLTALKTGVKDCESIQEFGYNESEYKPEDFTIVKVFSNSSSVEEVQKFVRNYREVFAKTNYTVDEISDYIREIDEQLKIGVGHIDINDDGTVDLYDSNGDEIAKGEKITKNTDPNNPSKYDLSNLEQLKQETVDLNEKINDENKTLIEGYLKELTGTSNVEFKSDKEGIYTLYIEGTLVAYVDKDSTLSETIGIISEKFNGAKSLDKYSKSLKTNKVKHMINNNAIYIHIPTFKSVMGTYDSVQEMVNSARSKYNIDSLTEKLSRTYSSLVSSKSPTTQLLTIANLCTSLTTNIDYSLQAYSNIDRSLGIIINSIISEIFSNQGYENIETQEFYESGLEARKEYLADTIKKLDDDLEDLKNIYKEMYPNDSIFFDKDLACLIMGLGKAFGFVKKSPERTDKIDVTTRIADRQCGVSVSTYLETIDFIKSNDNLLGMLKSYSEGSNWEDSGLYDFYVEKHNIKDAFLINSPWQTEKDFLHDYICFQPVELGVPGWNLVNSNVVYGEHDYQIYYNDEQKAVIKSWMSNQLGKMDSITGTVISKETGEEVSLTGMDLLKYYVQDIREKKDAISTAEFQLKNLKIYEKIMPYEADMAGDDYLKELVKNWNKINVSKDYPDLLGKIEYLSQQEIALYMKYWNAGDKESAKGYLEAMDDLINQRNGFTESVTIITQYKKWFDEGGIGGLVAFFKSGLVDGFSTGIDGFFRNVGRGITFSADGRLTAAEYRDLFIMSILSGGSDKFDANEICKSLGLDEMDENFKLLLKQNYTVFKSVGSICIPATAAFIPGVGPALSKLLVSFNTLGSSAQSAMQWQLEQKDGTTDAFRAYAYGLGNVAVTLLMNKYLSGIAGLNGNTKLPSGFDEFLFSMLKQGGRAEVGVYVDALLRASILGQPVDIAKLPAQASETALNSMLVAAAMNGITIINFKVGDFIFKYSSSKYNSVQEFLADMQRQFDNSKFGKELALLKAAGGRAWRIKELEWDNTLLSKLLENSNGGKTLKDVTDQASSLLRYNLPKGERLFFDPVEDQYYIYNDNIKSAITVPGSWIGSRGLAISESNLLSMMDKSLSSLNFGTNHSIIENDDGSYTIDDGWDKINISKEIFLRHLSNIRGLTNEGMNRYLNEILSNKLLLENPVSNVAIYDDNNYDFLIQSFGHNISKNASGDYYINGVLVSSDKLNNFLNAISLTDDIERADYLLQYAINNPAAINNGLGLDNISGYLPAASDSYRIVYDTQTGKELYTIVKGDRVYDPIAGKSHKLIGFFGANMDPIYEDAKFPINPETGKPYYEIVDGKLYNTSTGKIARTMNESANLSEDNPFGLKSGMIRYDNEYFNGSVGPLAQPNNSYPEELIPENLVIVHKTDYSPKNGLIVPGGATDSPSVRPTTHVGINYAVKATGGFSQDPSWDSKPITYIGRLSDHLNRLAGGFSEDVFYNGPIEPKAGDTFMFTREYFDANESSILRDYSGYNIVVADGDLDTAIDNYLKLNGYYAQNAQGGGWVSNNGFDGAVIDMLNRLNDEGRINANPNDIGKIHDHTIFASYEKQLRPIKEFLQTSRGTTVPFENYHNVQISNDELAGLLQREVSGEINSSSIQQYMKNNAIYYDEGLGSFYVGNTDVYRDLMSNQRTIDPRTADMAYNIWKNSQGN